MVFCLSFVLFVLVSLIPSTIAQDGETVKGFNAGNSFPDAGGYEFTYDVTNEAGVDLRVRDLEAESDEADWGDSRTVYGSSGEGSNINLITLAKSRPEQMSRQGVYNAYKNYWGPKDYAHVFISGALNKDGEFKGTTDGLRAECVTKGVQYQAIWMMVIHHMELAVNECSGDAGLQNWDKAVAYYIGSLELEGNGKLLYALATKRCVQFNRCQDGIAPVNTAVMDSFRQGRTKLKAKSCDIISLKNNIIKQMTIPLMQGLIAYVFETDEDNRNPDDVEKKGKSHGEGWAFGAAILPQVANCDPGVARTIENNFRPGNDPMSGKVNDVVNDLTKVYVCLGFSCTDIGKLGSNYPECSDSGTFKALKGTENPSRDNSGDFSNAQREDKPSPDGGGGGLSGAAIGGIVAAVILAVVVVGFLVVYRRRKSSKGVVPSLHEGDHSNLESSL